MTRRVADPGDELPIGLRRLLRRVERRRRGLVLISGLAALVLVLAVGVMLGVALDLCLVLPAGARWALWLLWIVAAVLAFGVFLVRPLMCGMSPTALAFRIEDCYPDVAERLSGAVALHRRGDQAHGAAGLIAALIAEADVYAAGLDARRVIASGWAVRRGVMACCVMFMMALSALLYPDPCVSMIRRFVTPWANVERVARSVVTVLDGDRFVGVGDAVAITASTRPRFGSQSLEESVQIEWDDARGVRHQEPMPPAGPATAAGARTWRRTLPSVSEAVVYRVKAGSAVSRAHRITVVEPPALAGLDLRIEAPAYMRKPAEARSQPIVVTAWEGSAITARLTATSRLKSASIDWPGVKGPEALAGTPADASGRLWTFPLSAVSSGPFTFTLVDEHGIGSRPEPPRRLVVRPDAPPTARFVDAETEPLIIAHDDVLIADVFARDDFAIQSATIQYTVRGATSSAGDESKDSAVTLTGFGTPSARGAARLALGPLGLRPGDVLAYRVGVRDSKPDAPQEGWTPERLARIVARAEPLAARRAEAARKRLQDRLDRIQDAAEANRRTTEQLRFAADAARREAENWSADRREELAALEAAAGAVADHLRQFSRELADQSQFAPLAPEADRIAETEAEAGRRDLDEAGRAPDADARLETLKRADASLTALRQRLDALERGIDEQSKRPPKPNGGGSPVELARSADPSYESERSPTSAAGGTTAADPSELQGDPRGQSGNGRAWGELPGHLRTAILQMAQGRFREDYARIIELYYREIAAQGRPQAEKPAARSNP